MLPAALGSAANTLSATLAILCKLARPAAALTPLRNRTKTISGPLRFGSGLRRARWNAGGARLSETSAPMPIEV